MPRIRSNRDIDQFLLFTNNWEIDPDWGLEQLAGYLQELELIENGQITFQELELSRKRQEGQPSIIDPFNYQQSTLGRSALYDPESTPKGSFAHLRLSGVMRQENSLSRSGVRQLADDIRQAAKNPNIDGILLEVNSGGGEGIAGTTVQNAIREVDIPVVTYAQMIGSAAYKGVLPSDLIIASGPDAQVGSISAWSSIIAITRRIFTRRDPETKTASLEPTYKATKVQ